MKIYTGHQSSNLTSKAHRLQPALFLNQEHIKNRQDKIPKTGVTDQSVINTKPSGWKNPGAGVVTIYKTENGPKVIRGKRFDAKWKIAVGGAVEDETLNQAIRREHKEETFGLLQPGLPLGKAHMNNSRKVSVNTKSQLSNGYGHSLEVKGYDYLTVASEMQISSEKLNQALQEMNAHASNAGSALKALTDKKISSEERKELAQTALQDQALIQMISDLKNGKGVVELLNNIVDGNEFSPIHQFKDERSQALMTFTEFSKFEIVPLETAISDLKRGKTEDDREVFKAEKDAFLSVTSQVESEPEKN